MVDEYFIRSIGVMIVGAALFAVIARGVKMPTIVAYLAAGVLLGVTGLLSEYASEMVHVIAETGIVLLLFLVGLELSFEKIRGVGVVACVAGAAQVLLTGLGGFAICRGLGFHFQPAMLLAIALTFSSTVIVVKLLVDNGDTSRPYGQIAIGVLLVQDLVVVILLTLVSGLGGEESLEAGAIAGRLVKAFAGMAVLLAAALAAAKWVLRKPFAWAERSPETLFIWSLCWCFIIVGATHVLQVSPEIGAFLAGVSLAQLPYHRDLQRRLHPLMNFFIAVFFVSLGIEMELDVPAAFWAQAAALAIFVVVGKFLIVMFIAARLGYSERTSYFAALLLTQVSEFSFIFIAQGIDAGLIDESAAALVGLVGLMSITVSTVAIVFRERLYGLVKRRGLLRMFGARDGDGAREIAMDDGEMEGHVIIVGMNALGRQLAVRLHELGEKVLAIDTDPGKLTNLPGETLVGDAEAQDMLKEAGLERAKLLISTLHIESTNDLLAFWCRRAGVPCSIHAVDLSSLDNLLDMDVKYLMAPKADGVKREKKVLERLGFLAR